MLTLPQLKSHFEQNPASGELQINRGVRVTNLANYVQSWINTAEASDPKSYVHKNAIDKLNQVIELIKC